MIEIKAQKVNSHGRGEPVTISVSRGREVTGEFTGDVYLYVETAKRLTTFAISPENWAKLNEAVSPGEGMEHNEPQA